MKKIGILAGTFDPIHNGHIDFATNAMDLGLEKVYFLVEPRPRRKQGVKALEHRQAMVRLALKKQPKLGLIQIDHARFNIEKTLPVIKSRFPGHEINLLFGDDVINHIVNWPYVEDLAKSTKLIIAVRHHDIGKISSNLRSFAKTRNLKFNYDFITPTQSDVSSSKIRLSLKKGQQPQGLANQVSNYINKNKLYSPFE